MAGIFFINYLNKIRSLWLLHGGKEMLFVLITLGVIFISYKFKKMKENTIKLERAKEVLKSAENLKKKIQRLKKR